MTTSSPDFGRDLSCTDDLTEDMREIEGPLLVVEALYRRFNSPRGCLWEDPDYGFDVRELLSKSMTQAQIDAIPGQIVAEAKKEPSVETFDAKVVKRDIVTLVLSCTGTTGEGPFSFVLTAAAAAVELSEVQVGS
jgi:hypothetical protein